MIFLKRKAYVLIPLCIICTMAPSFAQKNKKNKKQRTVSEKSQREAEYIFSEGQKFFMLEDYAKALVLFDQCLELNPSSATVYFKIAEIQTKNKAYKAALINILRAIEIDDTNKYFYLLAANIYNSEGNYAGAASIYETMLGKIDNINDYYFDLAAIYLYQKRYDDAISAYQRAEEVLGVSEEISYQKQKIYLQINQLNNAIGESEKLIKEFPEAPKHTISLVGILAVNGKEAQAVDLLDKLLEVHPSNSAALLMYADLLKKTDDLDTYETVVNKIYENSNIDTGVKVQLIAEDIYQIAQARRSNNPNITLEKSTLGRTNSLNQMHPNDIQVLAVSGDLLFSLNKKVEALTKYVKSLELDNSNFQIWQNVLQIESELGLNNELIDHADQALTVFPNQAVIYMYSGLAHLQLKNYKIAAGTLEQGKKLSIQNQSQIAIFSSLLGSAYNGSKDYSKSDLAYKKALEINPQDHQTLNNYSYFLSLREENLEDAEKMAKKVVDMSPDNATYLDTYAWVLYMRKKYKEAKIQIEKVIELGEAEGVNFDHYGDILFRLGEIQNAVIQWKKAKSLDETIEHIDAKIEKRSINE